MTTAMLCLAGVLAAHASPARASDAAPAQPKLSVGARLGYGVPFGRLDHDATQEVGDSVNGKIPIWLDAGVRLRPELYLGAYFQHGFGRPKDCPRGLDCSARVRRLGADLMFHAASKDERHVWLGLGFGYEWFALALSSEADRLEVGASGPELLLQAGLDFESDGGVLIGPYVALNAVRATSESLGDGETTASVEVERGSIHGWLQVGIRITL